MTYKAGRHVEMGARAPQKGSKNKKRTVTTCYEPIKEYHHRATANISWQESRRALLVLRRSTLVDKYGYTGDDSRSCK